MSRKNLITILRQYKLGHLTEDEVIDLIEDLNIISYPISIPITTPYYKWEVTC